MEEVRAYILSVTAAAVFCALVTTLAGNGKAITKIMKLMTGIVMAVVVIRPLGEVTISGLDRFMEELELGASSAVMAGEASSRNAMASRIKNELESYILDKAETLSMNLSVQVVLSEDGTMRPEKVYVEGDASPAARNKMKTMMRDDLGIPEEAVVWK